MLSPNLNAGEQNPYLWIGNEPTFAAPFLYNWTSQPYKTQALVRRILTQQYSTASTGLPGNDDEGATSGWFIWGALGLYPEIPAVPGLSLASPLFPQAVIKLGNGKLVTLKTSNTASNYIQSLMVNGKAHDSTWLPLDTVKDGGTLEFTLGDKPSCWASKPSAETAPPSFAPDGKQTPPLTSAMACTLPQ
ncbi:glycoside hydrolase family 92 protein [Phyllobacterium sp. 628]|uniref:glycoside hydrolase domain-containing protein n=1 Tax=Phyllobacterium sp. 628 TaxID=2718938 RepID=UPI00166220C9|nr:glycoside hydrolase domain-containing protein [Phyllobacterium sp. 628]QND51599.1 glycoside hydrolase family 92 protein [Phyllobacterium sp. 628]